MVQKGEVLYSEALYEAVLNRMNITWEPDEKLQQNIRNAIEEAHNYLCHMAGNYALSFETGEKRTLLIACSWYIVENKRADFQREYAADLLALRLEEGFGCGKDDAESEV